MRPCLDVNAEICFVTEKLSAFDDDGDDDGYEANSDACEGDAL